MKDYYAILELPPTASQEAIREQYLLLIQAWHPDKFPKPSQKAKAEEKCKAINIAYGVLGDPQKRAKYDRELRGQPSRPREQEKRRETEEQRHRRQAPDAQWRQAAQQRPQTEPTDTEPPRAEHETQAWEEEEWIRIYFEQARRRQLGQPPAGLKHFAREPIRVLIVDDLAHTRAAIRNLLGAEVDIRVVGEAPGGLNAIRQYDALLPDVMIVCINLPNLEGFDVTEAIRRKHPTAKVIILSEHTSSANIRRAAMAGACDYLTKPAPAGELEAAVRLAAGRPRSPSGM